MSQQTFKIAILSNDDGGFDIGFFAEDGSFQEGAENIAKLLSTLEAEGFSLPQIGQVENHRTGADKVLDRLHDTTHTGHHHG